MACYNSRKNPANKADRKAMWRWMAQNGLGTDSVEAMARKVNDNFYAGMAKPKWIDDVMSGKGTPYKGVASKLWKESYLNRATIAQANAITQSASRSAIQKAMGALFYLPRSIATAGHGVVFPVTHAGDLLFRPTSWVPLFKGLMRTYRTGIPGVPGGKAYIARKLFQMSQEQFGRVSQSTGASVPVRATFRDILSGGRDLRNVVANDNVHQFAIDSGLDVGPHSHPSGILQNKIGVGPANRAWDALTYIRQDLFKSQVQKFLKPGMTHEEALKIGKHIADWANHATGSAEGPIASLGNTLFGPKLTQSKLDRLLSDPRKTVSTFAGWNRATPGEKAAAWTRLAGLTQYATTRLAFLAANDAYLQATGSDHRINYFDPTGKNADFLMFKFGDTGVAVPGLSTEIKTLGQILQVGFFMDKGELRDKFRTGNKYAAITRDIFGGYATAKLTPTYAHGVEFVAGQTYRGQALPDALQVGREPIESTRATEQLSGAEYAAQLGPIPLEGPTGYVFEQLKENGMSDLEATKLIKAFIQYAATPDTAKIGIPGAMGLHVKKLKEE